MLHEPYGPRGAEDERDAFWTDLGEVTDAAYRGDPAQNARRDFFAKFLPLANFSGTINVDVKMHDKISSDRHDFDRKREKTANSFRIGGQDF